MGPRGRSAVHRAAAQALTVSLVAPFERAIGLPWWRRSLALIVVLSASYLGIGAVAIAYVLPVGFDLSGATLLLARVAVVMGGGALIAYGAIMIRRSVGRRARLWALARALGWGYAADVGDRVWGGSIDEQIDRSARTAVDYLEARSGAPAFDAVARTFAVGTGEGSMMHATLAVRIALAAEAPRIQLRSRRSAGVLSSLPRRPRGRTELRLEGNFSDVFAVSVPTGYERDALYLLTPDLMAILLDNAADLDLEIVDRTLHVYFPPLDLTDPAKLSGFLTVIDALSERFARRTELYRDDEAPPLDPEAYRRSGDTLSAAARKLDTRGRVAPVVAAVLAPLAPLAIGVVWLQVAG